MARGLTMKQRKYANMYLKTGNGTKSALEAYDTTSELTAATIHSENIRKPKVIAYIEGKAEKAAEFVFELAKESKVDAVRLSASKDILDRAGYRAAEKSEQTIEHKYSGGVIIANLASEVAQKLAEKKMLDASQSD